MNKGLKPWEVGQSGNPGGRPALPAHIRTARKENQVKLIMLVAKHFNLTTKESAKEARKEGTPQIEKAVRKMVHSAVNGSVYAFQYLMGLMAGKIPETDFDGATEDEILLFQRVREALNEQKELDG